MPDAAYIQRLFEASAFVAGLFYLVLWDGGRKPTNGQFLLVFAIGLAAFPLLDLLSAIVPTYVVLMVCLTPLFLSRLLRLLRRRHS